MNKIIPLSIRRFASCSDDCTFKIWKNDDTHECLSTLKHNGKVSSIIQLRNQVELVSCGHNSSTGISFWNINDYTQQRTIEGYCVHSPNQMIELFNGNIALFTCNEPYRIVIIARSSYKLLKEIELYGYITDESSLCTFNEHSFICVYKGTFLHISNSDFSILFESSGQFYNGDYNIIPIEQGKYFVLDYRNSVCFIKPEYA